MTVLDDMCAAARLAGTVLRERQREIRRIRVESKGTNDLVTAVDREAEEAVVACLQERWPGVPFLAEESDSRKTAAAERWILDPLDGTTNYVHGYPCYAVSIAYQAGGGIQAGAVYDPVRDEMYTATAGGGAHLNQQPIAVSSVSDLASALLVTGFPFRRIHELDEYMACFRRLLARTQGIRRDGSAALDLCAVAAGRLDGFWENGLAAWDVAAGALLVQEAGGRVSDYSGGENWLEGEEMAAACPGIHSALLRTLAEARNG